MAESEAEHRIAIPKQLPRGSFPGKRLHNLVLCPLCGGMVRDVEAEHLPPLVGQDEEAEQHPESGGRNGEEVDRDQVTQVVLEDKISTGL